MNKKKKISITIFALLVSSQFMSAVQFGSDTAVAVVTAVQSIANGDVINGFSIFTGGITNSGGAAASARYNNYFPIYGPLTFNSGLFNLNRNLTLGSNATLVNGAQFNGNGFSLNLPTKTSNFVIPAGTVMGNLTLSVNSPIQLNAVLTFTNNCVIEGNGNIIDCTSGALAVGAGGSLNIQNAILTGLSNNRFYCYDNTGTVTLENVTCVLNNTLTFSQGRLEFIGDNLFTSTQIFLFQSPRSMTIHSNSTWMFDSGMTFSYAAAANNLLAFDDITATLKLYETTLYANTPGLNFTKGTVILDGACTLINDAASSANGISIGNGISSASNVTMSVLAESGINITRGFFVNNNV